MISPYWELVLILPAVPSVVVSLTSNGNVIGQFMEGE